ncbi:hypothetical protein BU23DRAFT_506297 [Bimuria novae-zelandiae CBS 107.79]|uniref:F-box domain-containing protein n=1 Tax=Bimuria novae-zelandiae CBS 107.79 TaxID=1447943 RepID=A0A6A5V965_9PLEO|nr:hypothetical protein BU23DRAFT_506297 [Bimuria novae-zelandiae CBS 107.79]
MRHLPEELILQIIAYLEPEELVKLQYVSRQFLNLSRDNNLWRLLCFEHSAGERRRRRLHPASDDMDPRLAELIRAANEVANAFPTSVHDAAAPSVEAQVQKNVGKRKAALLANWDPTYPGERVDFYQEFIQRHAPHSMSWFQDAKHGHRDDNLHHEATGAGILYSEEGLADKLVAPLEDGSISIWDASASNERQGRIIATTAVGLLPNKGSDLDHDTRLAQSQAMMTETGAVECVSIDSRQKKGFFAVQNTLSEVDLQTLQVVSRTPYPFPITALSAARHPTPITVGTNWTVHLHDTRKPPSVPAASHCELIGGSTAASNSLSRLETGDFGGHVSLAQPGALSILHLPTTREWDGNGDIWVAGRFTSFLNFDRRFFPRLRGTVHSGARLSCLTALPYPFVPHDLRVHRPYVNAAAIKEAKETPGHTLIATGEYKGKGSLELYGLSPDPTRSINSSDARTTRNAGACYQNRQTASASKLLSVAPHGTRIVFADGDGNLKWVERDGSTPVRHFNINESAAGMGTRTPANANANAAGGAGVGEDIVKKILPTVESGVGSLRSVDVPLGRDNLVVWTGDGRLGMVGFGREGWDEEVWFDAVEEVESEEGRRRREREREFAGEMRRALEMQAREARWMRGYGL